MSNADRLVKMMTKIECAAGETQIERILSHAIAETTKLQVNALVFVGDAMEENADILVAKGARARPAEGLRHSCSRKVRDSHVEISLPRDRAVSTGGAYGRFDAGAAEQLGELLKAVAVFATGGIRGAGGPEGCGQRLC